MRDFYPSSPQLEDSWYLAPHECGNIFLKHPGHLWPAATLIQIHPLTHTFGGFRIDSCVQTLGNPPPSPAPVLKRTSKNPHMQSKMEQRRYFRVYWKHQAYRDSMKFQITKQTHSFLKSIGPICRAIQQKERTT